MKTSEEVVDQLVQNHRDFLRYVERRVGNRAVAEEILQEAFVRSLERHDEIRDSVVGWFYRVLRNAVIDHQRRQTVANRRLDEFAAELEATGRRRRRACERRVCLRRPARWHAQARVCGRAPPHRRRPGPGQGLRGCAGHLGEQRGRADLSGARGAAQAGRPLLRNVRRTRVPRLHVQSLGEQMPSPCNDTGAGSAPERSSAARSSASARCAPSSTAG